MSHPTVSYTFNLYPTGNNTPALATVSSTPIQKEYALLANTTYHIQVTGGLSYNCYNLLVTAPAVLARNAGSMGNLVLSIPEVTQLNDMAYPNPHAGSFNIRIASPENGIATIALFTVSNQRLVEKSAQVSKGENNIIPLKRIRRGTIFYRVQIGKHIPSGKIASTN